MSKTIAAGTIMALFFVALVSALIGQFNPSIGRGIWSMFTQGLLVVVGGTIAIVIVIRIVMH